MTLFARVLTIPYDSPEHRDIRNTAILAGGFLAARYFLSVLAGVSYDYSSVTEEDYLAALRDYLAASASPLAVQFCVDAEGEAHVAYVVLPTLMDLFYERTGVDRLRKPTKEERALVLLLEHADWSDDQIRAAMKTTNKQMARWSTFRLARRIQRRYLNGER